MKILMVLDHEFPPDIRVENEIYSLKKAGHEVHLACFTRKNKPLYEDNHQYIVHRRNISGFLYKSSVGCLKFPFYFNFWRNFISDLFKHYTFNSIHIHDLPLAQLGYEIKKEFNIPFILDLHENWPAFVGAAAHTNTILGKFLSPVNLWEEYEQKMVNKADFIIAIVEEMKERLIAQGADGEKVFVVPNTVRLDEYQETKEIPDKNYVTLLYSGGIDNQRGLQIAIEGLSVIIKQYTKLRLWIVGKGSYEQELRKKAEQLNVLENVTFWGWQKPDAMFELIQKADIAIIPYIRTVQTDCSSPNKLFQYMYAKKPILASNCTSIERILKDTEGGICYIHNDPADFVHKALRLAEDRLLRVKLGENGYQAVIKKYNWDFTATGLTEIYKKIA
jgi:glycosyltransferase involved in cell wall biosynthesis